MKGTSVSKFNIKTNCGIETCHAVFCSKCNVMLADYDHEETS